MKWRGEMIETIKEIILGISLFSFSVIMGMWKMLFFSHLFLSIFSDVSSKICRRNKMFIGRLFDL